MSENTAGLGNARDQALAVRALYEVLEERFNGKTWSLHELMIGFSNGEHRNVGQVMLASFANNQGLQPVSDTRWVETLASGVANYDTPGVGTLGSVIGHSLEGSNVTLTNELVELIQAQTAYQANSKTLSTEAELMQTLIRAT